MNIKMFVTAENHVVLDSFSSLMPLMLLMPSMNWMAKFSWVMN